MGKTENFYGTAELPEGIVKVELNRIEALALKILAFTETPLSKNEMKQLVWFVLSYTLGPNAIRQAECEQALRVLESMKLVGPLYYGHGVDRQICERIKPLFRENQPLIRAAAMYFFRENNYSNRDVGIHLAVMAQDFDVIDKHLYLSHHSHYRDVGTILFSALLKAGDLTLINPWLSKMHQQKRDLFLSTATYITHYPYFKQLAEVFNDPAADKLRDLKYLYASCAHLVLPVEEVEKISNNWGLERDSLFFCTLLRGDFNQAMIQGIGFLSTIQEREGHRRKELPGIYGLLYGLLLIASGDANQLALAATFIRNASKGMPQLDNSNPFRKFAQLLLLYIDQKTGKKMVSVGELHQTYDVGVHDYLLASVMSWLGKPYQGMVYFEYLKEKVELEFRGAGLQPAGETKKAGQQRLSELREKFGQAPLADLVRTQPVWESILSLLEKELNKTSDTKSKTSALPAKRLVWLVDPLYRDRLVCMEQSRTKSGWSQGKERSLLRMLNECPEFAIKEDQEVLACLQKHSYYSDVVAKDWFKLIKCLSAHPEVYTLHEPRLPLKIRVQEVHVQVGKTPTGLTISMKPHSPENRIVKESPTTYIYTEWSNHALRIHNLLSDSGLDELEIPNKGLEKARPVIDRLHEVMPVAGDEAGHEQRTSDNIPVLQLTPWNDSLHVQFLVEVLKDGEARFMPGVGSAEVVAKDPSGTYFTVLRDRAKEKSLVKELSERIVWLNGLADASSQLMLDSDADILDFLADVKEYAPEVKVIWPKGERLKVAKVVTSGDLFLSINKSKDWFALDGEVEVNETTKLSMAQLLEKTKGGTQRYIQLDEKTYLKICKDLQKRLAALDVVVHPKGSKLMFHQLGSQSVEMFAEGAGKVGTDKTWKQHLDKMEQLKTYKASLPTNLQAELRPYQQEGVLWLDRLYNWGVGACLADDMGLGKTLQVISILLKYAPNGASLVLAPSSVCGNWLNELKRFAPTLNGRAFEGQDRGLVLDSLEPFDVLVVSYGLLQANPDLLGNHQWNVVALDEAHAIKNANSVRSKAVMKLDAKFRVITTGTPMQNHLGELWNLFQFINPGMLGSKEFFNVKFVKRDDGTENSQTRKALNRYISPFILRRNKSDVLDDLPEKTEITITVSLSEQERAMYEVLRQEAIERIANGQGANGAKQLQILAEITKLRLMCCHPRLVAPQSDLSSSKLEALETLVDDLLAGNHKALIFSQFTKHLDLIRAMLDRKGLPYQYLDGSTPVKERELAISQFQGGQSDLFLISLKAGGVGLNLTAADYVIHMDPWWNPAVEDQASDRAHRIGQQRPVTIYRMIAENTIEEKIVKMHQNKRDLADQLLANTDMSAKISTSELMALISGNSVMTEK